MALLARFASVNNKFFKIPYYFTLMNVPVILGFFRYRRAASLQSEKRSNAQREVSSLIKNMYSQAHLSGNKSWFAKAFNTSILEKSRLAWVDYLRGIAIVLVVYRHVLLGLQRGNLSIPESMVNANMIFYSFRMPLFFILSGIFISSGIAKRSLRKLIFIKFENLLYPYLIWVFIQHCRRSDHSRNRIQHPYQGQYILVLILVAKTFERVSGPFGRLGRRGNGKDRT